jgi:glycosyltransferase involved in cell wall biosynthesis
MTRKLSIASVTVATNAAEVLPTQLDALLRQSRPLEEIIIVDNGSTDSTVEMICHRYPQITILALGQNLGVGGAYAAGLSYAALDKKHDWVWLLDDDSVPEGDAMEQLLLGYVLSEQQEKNWRGRLRRRTWRKRPLLSWPALAGTVVATENRSSSAADLVCGCDNFFR